MNDKIDFVVTWVDDQDPKWLKEKEKYKPKSNEELDKNWNDNEIRYRDWNLLKYWFRGVEKFAPWVNKVYFVTCGQKPEWLNEKNEKLVLVNHKDFIPEKYLPTFNSNAIELNIHRIKGLSDKFVLFNDDMYIINKTKPTDFFKNGLPCETATSDCVPLEINVGHSEIPNMKVLNKYYKKRKVQLNNFSKWFNIKYRKHIFKNIFLFPWDNFTGLYEGHIPSSYIKKYYKEIWEKEYALLDKTCNNKFRTDEDINHWLIKGFQLCNGDFVPRNPNIGKVFLNPIDSKINEAIVGKKYKMCCINDAKCKKEDYINQKQKLHESFELILPEKSSFEK